VRIAVAFLVVLSACGVASEPGAPGISAAKRARLVVIRDTSAERGLSNAALLAGIAESETHVAHCWSDATYACPGPDSPSCNGPIIAGSADGPCSAMQGGLGMFQLDAGTCSGSLAVDPVRAARSGRQADRRRPPPESRQFSEHARDLRGARTVHRRHFPGHCEEMTRVGIWDSGFGIRRIVFESQIPNPESR